MHSIQARLATGVLVSLIVLLVGQWIIVAYSIRTLSERYVTEQLRVAGDTLLAAVTIEKDQPPRFDMSRAAPVYTKPFSGHYFTITAGNEHFYSRSLWDEKLPVNAIDTGQSTTQRIHGPRSQELLLLTSRYEKQGADIHLAVAQDIGAVDNDIDRFLLKHGIVSLIILLILVVIQIIIVRRSLHPVENVRRELRLLETGEIENLNENVPVELLPLVREINTRIKAVKARLQRSRHATGNLAHALKAPLTLINQLLQQETLNDNPELRAKLVEYTHEIKSIIDRELKRVRFAGSAVGGRQAKINLELEHLVDALSAMYRDKNLSIEYKAPDDCVSTLEREDLHEILGNLLDNACKWANSRVMLTVECQHRLVFCVEDDGPGIPEHQREAMMQRGKRLDEQTAGHGLGLAIVKEAVDQYGGQISLTQSTGLGGLKVVIEITPNG